MNNKTDSPPWEFALAAAKWQLLAGTAVSLGAGDALVPEVEGSAEDGEGRCFLEVERLW